MTYFRDAFVGVTADRSSQKSVGRVEGTWRRQGHANFFHFAFFGVLRFFPLASRALKSARLAAVLPFLRAFLHACFLAFLRACMLAFCVLRFAFLRFVCVRED